MVGIWGWHRSNLRLGSCHVLHGRVRIGSPELGSRLGLRLRGGAATDILGASRFKWRSHQCGGKLNETTVGGKLFVTTVSTLRSGGPDSLFSVLSARLAGDHQAPIFIDRDLEIFSVLLFLLHSCCLSFTSRRFTKQELADEALYYGVESRLRYAASPPPLSGIDASVVATIRPASDGFASAFTAGGGDGSLWIAHGGQVSSYDWNLVHAATVRTHLDDITAISRVRSDTAALGSVSPAGIHFHHLSGNRSIGSVHWRDPSDPRIFKARVAAIADSADSDSVFAAFHCPHKENSVLAIDKSTLQIRSEIGRQPGSSAKSLVPGKLTWLPERGLLVGSSITCGAFGFSGYVRLWDPRSGDVVWEANEPGSGRSGRFGDPFADVAVDVEESTIFKVCSKSGDLGMADLRNLGDDPWVYLQEKNPSLRVSNGVINSTVIHCYKNQVFVGREGSLEVWSRVPSGETSNTGEVCEGLYRRNFVDKGEDCERGVIEKIECGGERLFVCRRDCEGIEVWESSNSSSVVSVL